MLVTSWEPSDARGMRNSEGDVTNPVDTRASGCDVNDTREGTGPQDQSRVSMLGPRIALTAVITIFVVLTSTIALHTPPWESADEPGHVQNIETLVAGHWYGMNSSCHAEGRQYAVCQGTEANQGPLYYLLIAGWQTAIGIPYHAPFIGKVNPAYYFGKAPVFTNHSAADRRFLLWLRFPNIVIGVLTILLAYAAVKVITKDRWTPIVGAALVAFLPRQLFLFAFVTNDNLVELLGATLTYLSLRFARRPSLGGMALVGVTIGLLVDTKLSTLPVAIVIPALVLLVAGWRRRVGFAATGVGAALLACGWYLAQNAVRYGDPLAREASQHYLSQVGGLGLTPGSAYVINNSFELILLKVPAKIIQGFWYQSDWAAFNWPWPVNVILLLLAAFALAGLATRRLELRVLLVLGSISLGAFLCVWMVALATPTYQAKYAYVGLTALAALAAIGLERWRVWIRFLLPAVGLAGTLVAIQANVLTVHWH
jgi:Dolichyl-phosphate-mannose-protein mannosyltransferase